MRSLWLSLLLMVLTGAPSWAAVPEPPVLYGGTGPDPAMEKEAKAIAGSSSPARWFLEPVSPVVDGLYALGAAQFTPCEGGRISLDAFRSGSEAALASLDLILPDEASEQYERSAAQLPCLEAPLPAAELSQFQFHRGIAALTRAKPDKELGLAAFAAAIAADPNTQWDEDYAAFPRSVFFEGKVALLNAPRARLWVAAAPDLRIWLEGRELREEAVGVEVLAGSHLVHIQKGELNWSGSVVLEPGAEVVFGDAAGLWSALDDGGDASQTQRAIAARRALAKAFGERVVVTRPGAFAVLEGDGTLGVWSDEGAYRPRLGMDLGGNWVFYERNIESPPVDIPNPSDAWYLPELQFVVRFHPVLSAHVGGGLAWSGPFEVGDEELWRLMGAARVGVGAERPDGRFRPGGGLDLVLFLPGEMSVAGNPTNVVLLGPVASATLAFQVTDLLWLQARAGAGWLGSETASVGLNVQVRLPPSGPSLQRVLEAPEG